MAYPGSTMDYGSGCEAADMNIYVVSTTTAALADIDDAINTTDKFAGKLVYNATTGAVCVSEGSTAAAVWNGADGTADHTPS